MAGEPPHRKQQGDGAAVAGQASLPGHENLQEPCPGAKIVIRLVKNAVSQTGAHDRRDEQGVQQRVHQLGVHFLPGEEPFEQVPADDEARHEEQAVPADLERTDVEKYGIDVPMHEQERIYHKVLCFMQR